MDFSDWVWLIFTLGLVSGIIIIGNKYDLWADFIEEVKLAIRSLG